jgi:hypothetical protein
MHDTELSLVQKYKHSVKYTLVSHSQNGRKRKGVDKMRKLILLCVTMMILSSVPTAMAITVDGQKSAGEWDENWLFSQTEGSTYDPNGPFGDRFVIEQGGFGFATGVFYDEDPDDDSGTSHDETMATAGIAPSGYDIKSLYAHYDFATDTLYGLCEAYGTPGDLDGNGNINTLSVNGDDAGVTGPAGTGIGEFESWEIRATQVQGGVSKDVWILVRNNNWTVYDTIALTYDDVDASFGSVYEISIENMSNHFVLGPGAPTIMIEVKAGGNRDVPGEDTATAYIVFPIPVIKITKYVQDLDGIWHDDDVVTLANGSDVHWKYVIKNIGNEPLTNVVVTDDKIGQIADLGSAILEIDEEMEFTADGVVPIPCQDYANMARVDANGVVSGAPVWDEDPAYYTCKVPVLTPTGLLVLIGTLGIIGIIGLRRRD